MNCGIHHGHSAATAFRLDQIWSKSFYLATLPDSIYQTSGKARKMTPPPMHQGRRVGLPSNDTPKEAKLHGRQCPSDASLELKLPTLSLDAAQTRFRRLLFTCHAGNLAFPANSAAEHVATSLAENTQIIPKRRAHNQARRFWKMPSRRSLDCSQFILQCLHRRDNHLRRFPLHKAESRRSTCRLHVRKARP